MKKRTLIFAGILAGLPAFLINHIDSELITYWAIELIRHIQSGNLYHYAIDLYNQGKGINYSLWLDAVIALWELPLYTVLNWLHFPEHMIVYETWCKILIWIVNILTATEFYRVWKLFGRPDHEAKIGSCLYLVAPSVCLYGVGMGQVDCFGILFLLLSLRLMLEEKHEKAAVCAGISILCKFFSLMVIIPIFLLYGKFNKKTIRCILFTGAILIVEKISTILLIKDYFVRGSELNRDDFFPRLFFVSLNGTSVFLVIIMLLCSFCLYKNLEKKAEERMWISLSGSIVLAFFLFVWWHSQWFLFAIAVILLQIILLEHKTYGYLLYFVLNTGFVMSQLRATKEFVPIDLKTAESFIGRLLGIQQEISVNMRFPIPTYTAEIGRCILIVCMLLINLLPWLEKRGDKVKDQPSPKMKKMLLAIQWMPTLGYLVFSLAAYL